MRRVSAGLNSVSVVECSVLPQRCEVDPRMSVFDGVYHDTTISRGANSGLFGEGTMLCVCVCRVCPTLDLDAL